MPRIISLRVSIPDDMIEEEETIEQTREYVLSGKLDIDSLLQLTDMGIEIGVTVEDI